MGFIKTHYIHVQIKNTLKMKYTTNPKFKSHIQSNVFLSIYTFADEVSFPAYVRCILFLSLLLKARVASRQGQV